MAYYNNYQQNYAQYPQQNYYRNMNQQYQQYVPQQNVPMGGSNQNNLIEALQLIKEAVEGEKEDKIFYENLIKLATDENDKQIIMGIRDDEIKHNALFRQMYLEHTGQNISIETEVEVVEIESYCEGLKKALIGEQNAVAKYRKILYAMNSRRHINMMIEIITDEIRHGSLYNYLYSKNKCQS